MTPNFLEIIAGLRKKKKEKKSENRAAEDERMYGKGCGPS